MRRATLAGIDSIEHGYGGTDEVFSLMEKTRNGMGASAGQRRGNYN